MQDANQHTNCSYAYDARSRLVTITYPPAPPYSATTTGYTRHGMGRQRTTTDQAGQVTTKTYDAVGRLLSVKDALTNLTRSGAYDFESGTLIRLTDAAAGRITAYQVKTRLIAGVCGTLQRARHV